MEFGGWSAFFSGVAFTALLMVAGLGIGLYVGRRRGRMDVREAVDLRGVAAVVDGLADWTTDVMEDVTQYNELVDAASRWLTEGGEPDRERMVQVVQVLQTIARTNEQLKQRLTDAENRLHEQTRELQVFMSEARTDPLTGLANRRAFTDELARRESEWARHEVPFAVVMLDVDYFKRVNDTYGHSVGDDLLVAVAKKLKEAVRLSDYVARIGGEEFAVLLAFAQIDAALQTAERIRRAMVDVSVSGKGRAIGVTISAGVAQAAKGESGKQLLTRADEALYAAKGAGRNCVWWHDGREVRPYGEAPGGSADSAAASTNDSEDAFLSACAELRRQLWEIAGEAVQESRESSPVQSRQPQRG